MAREYKPERDQSTTSIPVTQVGDLIALDTYVATKQVRSEIRESRLVLERMAAALEQIAKKL